jgi:hypothetical protein
MSADEDYSWAAPVGTASAADAFAVAPSPVAAATDPYFTEARETLRLLAQRKLSARELMAAHLARIRAVNPKVNAIVGKLADDVRSFSRCAGGARGPSLAHCSRSIAPIRPPGLAGAGLRWDSAEDSRVGAPVQRRHAGAAWCAWIASSLGSSFTFTSPMARNTLAPIQPL